MPLFSFVESVLADSVFFWCTVKSVLEKILSDNGGFGAVLMHQFLKFVKFLLFLAHKILISHARCLMSGDGRKQSSNAYMLRRE